RAARSRSALDCPPAAGSGSARGTNDRQVFVIEQPPSRRTIEIPRQPASQFQPTSYRLALPYVVFVVSTIGDQIEGVSTYFRTAPIDSLDAPLFCSTLPNTSDDGIVCLGSVRVTGASVGERIVALVGALLGRRFNQDLRRHPMPFSGGFRAWASRSRRDPLAALSIRYDPYWRTLRQVVAQMAGVAPTDLPAATPELDQPPEAEVRTPEPEATGEEVSPMSSLPEHVNRTPAIRPRSLALMVAPFIGERVGRLPMRHVEGSRRSPSWRRCTSRAGHSASSSSPSDLASNGSSTRSIAVRIEEEVRDVPDPRSRPSLERVALPAFIVARDGLYLRKQSLLGLSQTKVGRVAHLPEGKELVDYAALPKVPADLMARAVGFFRAIYRLQKTEAAILLLWRDGSFDLAVPDQRVSSVSVKFDRPGRRRAGRVATRRHDPLAWRVHCLRELDRRGRRGRARRAPHRRW
ncbi:MAG: hypothetical protein M5T61_16995, partial [Acidimicrobiia bacterium]|nr:hypothetical protein [Acidimicrobiia bacterium]